MVTKVMKYEIKSIDYPMNEFKKVLKELQYQSWKFANKAIQMYWSLNNCNYDYGTRFGDSSKDDKLPTGKRPQADIREQHKNLINKLHSNGIDALITMAKNEWNKNHNKIIKGETGYLGFKRTIPIEIHNKQMKDNKGNVTLYKNRNEYYIDIALISKNYANELGRKSCVFKLLLITGDKYQTSILDRIINGEYKLSMSKILKNNKGKWFLNLAYTFDVEKEQELNKNRIMGIDLGVNIPACLAINDLPYFREYVGDKNKIENFRKQIESRKKQMQRQGKWCGDGRRGRGTKTRIKPIEKLSSKIHNFKNLTNHEYSKYIVKQAVDNGCGVIQVEDLNGIAKDNIFLKNWSYDDLQRKIEYKAKEKGIIFKKINPKYTSSRCNKCGHIHRSKDKEEWRPEQQDFICQSCGHRENADLNAARNIATPNIEKIIQNKIYEIVHEELLKLNFKEIENKLYKNSYGISVSLVEKQKESKEDKNEDRDNQEQKFEWIIKHKATKDKKCGTYSFDVLKWVDITIKQVQKNINELEYAI